MKIAAEILSVTEDVLTEVADPAFVGGTIRPQYRDIRLKTLHKLVQYHVAIEKFERATAYREEILRTCEAYLGKEHFQTHLARFHLQLDAFRSDPKSTPVDTLLDVAATIRDRDDPQAAGYYTVALENMGNICFQAQMHEEAKKLLESAYQEAQQLYSENHPRIMEIGRQYARALIETGDLNHARRLLEDFVEQSTRVFGSDYPYVPSLTRKLLCCCLLKMGEHDDILKVYRESLVSLTRHAELRKQFVDYVISDILNANQKQLAIQLIQLELEVIEMSEFYTDLQKPNEKWRSFEYLLNMREFDVAQPLIEAELKKIYAYSDARYGLLKQNAACLAGLDNPAAALESLLEAKNILDAFSEENRDIRFNDEYISVLKLLTNVFKSLGNDAELRKTEQQLVEKLAEIEGMQDSDTELPPPESQQVIIEGVPRQQWQFFGGDLKILLPADFQLLSPEETRSKYPEANRTTFWFKHSNPGSRVEVKVSLAEGTSEHSNLDEVHTETKSHIEDLWPGSDYIHDDDSVLIRDRMWSYFDILLPGDYRRIRYKFIGSIYRDRLLQVGVSFVGDDAAVWERVSEAIIRSCMLSGPSN